MRSNVRTIAPADAADQAAPAATAKNEPPASSRVRLLVILLLATSLAGCTLPQEEQPSPLIGVCPQWIDGPPQDGALLVAGAGAYDKPATANHSLDGFALDRYRIHLVNGSFDGLTLRVFANGTQLGIMDFRGGPSRVPALDVTTDAIGHEFDVHLSAIAYGTAAAPADVTLAWNATGAASLQYTVTPGYRVCGAIV